MAKGTKAQDSAQVKRLRQSLACEREKSAALARERKEAREQQAAAAEILKVISRSPSDAQPVFDAIVKRARRLLGGYSAVVARVVDGIVHLGALTSTSKAGDAIVRKGYPRPIDQASAAGRAIRYKRPSFVTDIEKAPGSARSKQVARKRGYRSILAVPMLCDGAVVGSLNVTRKEARPFSKQEIALLETFAEQAVIAIENVRRFNETKEALERQTATAEILKVIARSPSEVQPVFDAIVASAHRLIGGNSATMARVADGMLHLAATTVREKRGVEALKSFYPVPVSRGFAGKMARTLAPVYIADVESDPDVSSDTREMLRMRGIRSLVAAPLVRDGAAIGTINVARTEPGNFNPHHVELLKTFADQAVIAIENVRLFNETKEALERQTATAEILRVISNNPANVQPVFDSIVGMAFQLLACSRSAILLSQGDHFSVGAIRARADLRKHVVPVGASLPINATANFPSRVIVEKRPLHLPDWSKVELPELERRIYTEAGCRASLMVPLLREDNCIGVLVFQRSEPLAFGEKEIALAQSFADQAVIAIENARLFNETKEALERQTATAEILRVIAGSPSDMQPVFEAILDNAARLCDSQLAAAFRYDGKLLHLVATKNWPADALASVASRFPMPPDPAMISGRAILQAKVVLEEDTLADPSYDHSTAHAGGWRRMLGVPMMRDDAPIGSIVVTWREPGKIPERQVGLLKTFADQAVIAIENVRLFNETKEALEQQKASADILGVISSSISDTSPVFDKITESCQKLFGSHHVGIRLVDDQGMLQFGAHRGPALEKLRAAPPTPLENTGSGLAIKERAVKHYPDVFGAADVPAGLKRACELTGARSIVCAPMLWEGRGIGAIYVARETIGVFSEKEIALLKTFADQAVIAIQNARLFNETKESLERQTVTAEVLQVISSSVADTAPVFDKIIRSCEKLFGVRYANVALIGDDGLMHLVQEHSSTDLEEWEIISRNLMQSEFPRPVRDSAHGYAIYKREVLHYPDVLNRTDVPKGLMEFTERVSRAAGQRIYSLLFVPMFWEGKGIGAIGLIWHTATPFAEQDIRLLKTFADQAAIAIQNARLFNETKEALERQTATAGILNVISSSPTDVAPVFDVILENSLRLCEAELGLLGVYDGKHYRNVAHRGGTSEFVKWALEPYVPDPRISIGRVIAERQPVHHHDLRDSIGFREGLERPVRMVELAGVRSYLAVPLLKEGRILGAIVIYRREVRDFTQKQIDLVSTFASQAVIAIENVRLFKELEARTQALGKSVEKLTALGEVGRAVSSTLDLETVLKTIMSHALQLTGLDGGSIYEYDAANEVFRLQAADSQAQELLDAIRSVPIRKGDGTVGRVAITREPAQAPDILDETYKSTRKEMLIRVGYRAVLTVPLLHEDHVIGALSVTRKTPGPFADEVVELLKTFATQSAMAIQNARLFREIAEKGKQLEIASHHKSQFLASMSHELRTPLNALLGFNEMILGEVYGPVSEDMQPPLEQMQTSGKHLLRLINNVLDLAKIEAGRMELALADYSVQDTVESVRSTLRPLAAEKGIEFLATVPADIPLAYGDSGRITQCLMNLAGNSLKFTKVGKVEISVAENGRKLTYRVADTGVGIPPDKMDSLFTEFKQTDATIASEYGGTGLGLSISKKFVEMHGGRIWAESVPGQGSTFVFEIPLRAGEGKEA
jgi:GAF domain-containing protein